MNLIETKGLAKQFNETAAVKDLNLSVREGACTALLGPNGAGKTTALNMLTGLMKPTDGTIHFHANYPGDRREYLGYLPQHPKFFGWMSGLEYVTFAAQLAGLEKEEAVARAKEMLDLVGLTDNRAKKTAGYSGGMKQRLGIAQALVHSPKMIMLDEPVSALDPIGRREILELMKELKKRTSILFSTHVLHDAEEVSDDIYIMKKGEVVAEGSLVSLQEKYRQPAIVIETERNLADWAQLIEDKAWLRHMNTEETKATLTVENIENARTELLNDSSLQQLNIVKFEVMKTSLEDLFMQVMN
ncbi:ABC transporter ATP-binding protein [Salisediminibacterium halotolerans]|uniref:ABC-2 type transport system ATP-binding protein n=1 Tax=Salisediminibacterium halotolerans TaxID=517425 RepID=A0A1H9VK95_9BACI|nr:ABC transporter ATP-binding protein [Salisediminibacterium haloalkalitolerans]SES22004.1 ABC-2 type transport system ATP-binding protein [Salisediminibacterium haloalkalitolerans]